MRKTSVVFLLSFLLTPLAVFAQDLARDLNERVIRVPLTVKELFVERKLFLETTVFKPDGNGPFPLLVLSHGIPRDFEKRRTMKRSRFLHQSREFVKLGFVVALPMRHGFANSDGNSLKLSCRDPGYHHAGLEDTRDLIATVDYMKKEPYVDGKRIVLAGQSGGGFASMACGSVGFDGLVAVLNFAGGRGSMKPDEVCSENDLISAMGRYGKTCRVPTLWIYTENDHYFSPGLSREMHAAYIKAGGRAKMILLPPFGDDGHSLFSKKDGIRFWLPEVKSFLRPLVPIRD